MRKERVWVKERPITRSTPPEKMPMKKKVQVEKPKLKFEIQTTKLKGGMGEPTPRMKKRKWILKGSMYSRRNIETSNKIPRNSEQEKWILTSSYTSENWEFSMEKWREKEKNINVTEKNMVDVSPYASYMVHMFIGSIFTFVEHDIFIRWVDSPYVAHQFLFTTRYLNKHQHRFCLLESIHCLRIK